MNEKLLRKWLPPRLMTSDGEIRKVGVEIELAGLMPELIAKCICELYGGDIKALTSVEYQVENTNLGDFKLELDASYLKALAEKQAASIEKQTDDTSFAQDLATMTFDAMIKTAEQLVPWEVVTPPIEITELSRLENLISALRERGALGTRNALHYAFGVHLNPELPDLSARTILSYMRAYFCLYDWIVEQEQIDVTRKLTTYIKHFDTSYIERVLDATYMPTQDQLIDDYLAHNPTRNRSLDLLPLFAQLDEPRVRSAVDDPRIKARPTFHYRLPNSDIDNPDWNLIFPWALWLEVEKLAQQENKLKQMCDEYRQELSRLSHTFERRWVDRVAELLVEE